MTNELEKQFFDTFGIEPKLDCKRCGAMNFALGQCAEVDCEKTYPQITDRILLELICICSIYEKSIDCCYWVIGEDIETLKKHILEDCIDYAKDIKHQVRTLFEEG